MILGASFDTPAENRAFAEKQGYRFDFVCDSDRALGIALGIAADAKAPYARRNTFVIGPTGKIEQILEKVDVRAHPAELLKSLP